MINAMVVDDEKVVRKGFIAMANWPAYGIRIVGEAKDGRSALAMLGTHDIDLLFVDISMPGMSGFELMEQVRKHYPKVKSVVLTCYHEFDYVQEALRVGAIDYVVKTLLNNNNVDETMNRIVKRLSWVTENYGDHAIYTFPGAVIFCSLEHPNDKEALINRIPTGRKLFPLNELMWMSVLGESDTSEWILDLPRGVTEGWQIVHVAASTQYAYTEAQTLITQHLRPYLFYAPSVAPIVTIQLEQLDDNQKPMNTETIEEALHSEWNQMKWLLYGKEWKSLIERIEHARPTPKLLLDKVEQLIHDWSIFLEWGTDEEERTKLTQNPNTWVQIKIRLSEMALGVQRRLADSSLSREVVVCLLQAMVYMRQNTSEDLNQADVAHHIGMGRSYFSQCYKKFTGLSFGDTIRKLRIDQAKLLLLHTDLSVSEIANKVGFNDDKYFSRVFRDRVSQYPSEFRMRSTKERG